jgi:hypothetical protein
MPTSDVKNADYWRARAEEMRAQANQMNDAHARQTLLEIAENYDQLAERTDAMTRGSQRLP